MPPPVASLLCYAFVAWLIYREIRNRPELSGALWLPTVWLFLSISRSLVYWVGGGSAAPGDSSAYLEGSPVDRNVRLVLMAWGLWVLHRRQGRLSEVLAVNRLILVIFAWMAVSVVWSDYPFVSFKRWVRAAGFVVMALIVLTEDRPSVALDAIMRRVVYLAVPISVLLIKYYPALGITFHRWQGFPMWVGIGISKNDLGVLCAYGGLFMVRALAAVRPFKAIFRDLDAWIHLFLLLLCLHMLRGSGFANSATSTVVLLIGVALVVGFSVWRSRPQTLARWALAAVVFAVPFVLFGGPQALGEWTTGAVGRDSTLTGRTEIWRAMFEVAARNPIQGTGYGAFYLRDLTYDWSEISGGVVSEGHNGYLDVYLELGLVGITLHAIFILATCFQILRGFAEDAPDAQLRTTLFAMLLLHNNTESGLFAGVPSLWFFYLVTGMTRRQELAHPAFEAPGVLPGESGAAANDPERGPQSAAASAASDGPEQCRLSAAFLGATCRGSVG